MRAQESINFMRGIGEYMRSGKESAMLNTANQQNPKMNMGKINKQHLNQSGK
jgi:hypothetical protein